MSAAEADVRRHRRDAPPGPGGPARTLPALRAGRSSSVAGATSCSSGCWPRCRSCSPSPSRSRPAGRRPRRAGPGFFEAITSNGLFVAFAALAATLPLFLPLAVAAASGDAIAGEANQGTLRYLLTIPAGRTRLLLTKYAAVVVFGLAATALVALAGVVVGARALRRR